MDKSHKKAKKQPTISQTSHHYGCERGMRPLLRRGDIQGVDYEMMRNSSLIDKSHKARTSQSTNLTKHEPHKAQTSQSTNLTKHKPHKKQTSQKANLTKSKPHKTHCLYPKKKSMEFHRLFFILIFSYLILGTSTNSLVSKL